jgi:hypothetical protein
VHEAVIAELKLRNIQEIFAGELLLQYRQALQVQGKQEGLLEELLQSFQVVVPMTVERLTIKKGAPVPENSPAPGQAQAESRLNGTTPKLTDEAAEEETNPFISNAEKAEVLSPVVAVPETPDAASEKTPVPPSSIYIPKPVTLLQSLSDQGKTETLAEKLQQTKTATLSDKLASDIIDHLHAEVSGTEGKPGGKTPSLLSFMKTGEVYTYVSNLFGADTQAWKRTVEVLDSLDSHHEAMDYLLGEVASRYDWDFDKPNVQAFIEVVENKFSTR